jgi:tRNA (guanine10-N2)-methyltransferase
LFYSGVDVLGQLITIKKTSHAEFLPPSFDSVGDAEESGDPYVPAHKDFREKYFQGFKKENER